MTVLEVESLRLYLDEPEALVSSCAVTTLVSAENPSATRSLLCRMIIRRTVCEGGSTREGNQTFGRTTSDIMGLHKGAPGEDHYIQVFYDQTFTLEHMLSASEGKVSPMTLSGDDPSP